MTPEQTAAASATAVTGVASHFMLDPATYATGGELGFEGMTFYVAGRAGALGDVDADVVTATFVYFHPDMIAAGWDATASVMPRLAAAQAFADCSHRWGREHIPASFDAAGLAELAGKVVAGASSAGAPLCAAWRCMPEPDDAPALLVHRMNVLRELRGGLHSCAVIAAGLAPEDALAVRTPYMAALFGWPEPGDTSAHQAAWDRAEADTNVAMAAPLSVLDEAERVRFVALCDELVAAIS
jgi:hypothetical protein